MKFIVNLAGKLLCPYQIIQDIHEQLPNNNTEIRALSFKPICELNTTNDWINLESHGKPGAIRAKAISSVLINMLKEKSVDKIALDIYMGKNDITYDNIFCLLFLSQSIQHMDVYINFQSEKETTLQKKLSCLKSQNNINIYLNRNNIDSGDISSSLAHLKKSRINQIKMLGYTLDDTIFADVPLSNSTINQIIGYSWMCLKSGGYELASQVLQLAEKNTSINTEGKDQLFMHKLMIRFFSHEYTLIAQTKFPEHLKTLSKSDQITLMFLTAYAATLSRNLDIANQFFELCGINENMPLTDEQSLFQLNLFALSKVLNGEIDAAFELEFRIKDHIVKNNISTLGLRYVNLINIARLYKKAKKYDLSLKYYQKAYHEIDEGGYSTSDHIYYNMNIGSLHETAGNSKQALYHWVKSALHWMACSNQHELSWRPRIILCKENISQICKPLPTHKANEFFINKITSLMQTCGISPSPLPSNDFYFVEDSSNITKNICYIYKNIILYTNAQKLSKPRRHLSESERTLSKVLVYFLQSHMDIPIESSAFIVDMNRGINPIHNKEEAFAYARFYHCKACWYEGQWESFDEIDGSKFNMSLSLSKTVSFIEEKKEGVFIRCARSFLNKTLQDRDEIDLVKQLQISNYIPIDDLPDLLKSAAVRLVNKQVLRFSYKKNKNFPLP